MMGLHAVMFLFIGLFGIIGALRGWAREILVVFSMVLALFIITVVELYVGTALEGRPGQWQFLVRASFIVVMALFGYQTPSFPGLGGKLPPRERLQDWMLGFFLGLINGYLIFGMLWFYLDKTGYPITAPHVFPITNDYVAGYLKYLPPELLKVPYIYFAVGVAFLFVIIVFV